MKRAWGIALTLLSGGVLASCASLLGAGGDYEIAASSSGVGGAAATVTSSAVGTGGDPATTASEAASSSSDASSGTGGAGGGVVNPPSWHRYSFSMATGTWSSALLSSVWTSANAPPSSGIVATCHLDHFDKLLVFTSDGMLHIQEGSLWLPPVPAQSTFNEITNPAHLAGLYHVPSDWNVSPMAMPLLEGLTFVDNPTYWVYNFTANNTATLVTQGLAPDEAPPGPPQATGRAQWFFEIWNKTKIGQPDGFAIWSAYGDGNVYKLPADIIWSKSQVESVPIWAGKNGAPDWASLKAAYFIGHPADGVGTVVFIGP
ncbi:MAG: hypothetical protein ABJE95_20120 [Byssovorax sp.]